MLSIIKIIEQIDDDTMGTVGGVLKNAAKAAKDKFDGTERVSGDLSKLVGMPGGSEKAVTTHEDGTPRNVREIPPVKSGTAREMTNELVKRRLGL
jgi:hypothetical protein